VLRVPLSIGGVRVSSREGSEGVTTGVCVRGCVRPQLPTAAAVVRAVAVARGQRVPYPGAGALAELAGMLNARLP